MRYNGKFLRGDSAKLRQLAVGHSQDLRSIGHGCLHAASIDPIGGPVSRSEPAEASLPAPAIGPPAFPFATAGGDAPVPTQSAPGQTSDAKMGEPEQPTKPEARQSALVEWSENTSDNTKTRLHGILRDMANELRKCSTEQLINAVERINSDHNGNKKGFIQYNVRGEAAPDGSFVIDISNSLNQAWLAKVWLQKPIEDVSVYRSWYIDPID